MSTSDKCKYYEEQYRLSRKHMDDHPDYKYKFVLTVQYTDNLLEKLQT